VTAVAGEAFTLSKAFNAAFRQPFDGWQAELAAPLGPSTGGGAQALQHVALIAPSGERVAVGSVDLARHTATLRSHALVDQLHQRRFGAPLPVSTDAYASFQDVATRLLSGASFVVTVEVAAPSGATPSSASGVWQWVLLAVLVLAVLAWWLLARN